jgi:hypothetical protein
MAEKMALDGDPAQADRLKEEITTRFYGSKKRA